MNWYYMDGDQQQGPIPHDELTMLITTGSLNAATPVWREGMSDWQELRKTELIWDADSGKCLETVLEAEVAGRHPEWHFARAQAMNSRTVYSSIRADSQNRLAQLSHKTLSKPFATWHADYDAAARALQPDGTVVVTQRNGQVCFLQLHHGNRRISIAEAEELLRSEGKI